MPKKNEDFQYLKLSEDKFREWVVVFADNAGILADQIRDYLDYVKNSGNYKSRYLQVGDGHVQIRVTQS